MARWRWLLLQFTRKLWVRATLIGALGILAAMAATLAERYMPWDLPGSISAEAVDSILSIIASSMLAVTTFSLSIMTSAFGAATNTVTPRATVLLIQDGITQNVLSTFIGSFLFSMVALVVLKTGAYGPRGRLVLFVVTVGIIVLIVIALLRWINHLMLLGRVGETTDRVERATRAAIEARLDEPFLGGRELRGAGRAAPQGAEAVRAGTTGYVQFIDMAALQDEGERAGRPLHVPAIPGTFVYPDTVLAWLGAPDAATGTETRTEAQSDPEADAAARAERIRQAFSVGTRRSYDQDPRFGIVVLSEIAIRALSPAVNDSGTAIDVIGRCARLLALWAEGARGDSGQSPKFPRIHVVPIRSEDLFDDAFRLVARDGAAQIEVQSRLQKALRALRHTGDHAFRQAAAYQSQLALQRAEQAMTMDADKQLLRDIVADARMP
ncbi:MAG: DUF2254 domain-containing protein [Achromobacter pulmonis]|uniref:DUF2254 domain-containing protein n=1 Tax=Achromobacter pulmonis TaxID=1389932 RepID=A0A6S7BZT0_9BURK|nr:DUF2254 domain-containing protein [Achromobacter pulmonis]MPT29802.1 DUF2254 domain-containing protein [Achromobacter sp.]CAB3825585.1 hypothetical protein LMG26788_00498 [Achromobacter pulmonis]